MWQPVPGFKASTQNNTTPSPAASANGNTPAAAGPATTTGPAVASSAPSPGPKTETPAPPAGPAANSAVQRCFNAYRQAMTTAGGPKASGAHDAAYAAFRNALPDITDRASAADFIACILKGIVLRVFWQEEGPRLISGARAAAALLPGPHYDRIKPGPKPRS